MTRETRTCQNCKKSFSIEPEDFDFYERIQVPPPTFCPECRLQRRLSYFCLTKLYKRKCDLCQKDSISMFAPDAPYTVYCPKCWWSDNWDPYKYGRDYDFSRPFFEQLNDLWHKTPMIGLSLDHSTSINSEYNNHAGHLKNCYLIFQADFDEECSYGVFIIHSKNTLDSSLCNLSEFCYDCMNSFKNNRCVGLRNQVTESLDCYFLKDSSNCQNCFGSANLKNQKNVLFNQKYSREEYLEKTKEFDLGSYQNYQKTKKLSEENWKKHPPLPYCMDFVNNCTGNYLFESKNSQECYEVVGAQDSKYLLMLGIGPIKSCYDISSWGNNIENCYECSVVGENASNIKFSFQSGINQIDAEYCNTSMGGSHHFACASVRKGKFVIFNKQYPEKEYFELKEKIIKHMDEMPYTDKAGNIYRYGEFFPIELSHWAYNETLANNFLPLTKEGAISKGYGWKEENKKEHAVTLNSKDLPDHIKDASENLLNEVIGCAKCGRGFKMIKSEFNFLKQMNLPLPRECPFCRIDEKFQKWVKNLTLVDRACSKCSAKFRTPYTEEEYKDIFCKECYLKEIV